MSHCYRWTIWTRVPLCALSECHLRTVVRVAAITVLLGAGVSLRPAHAQVPELTFPVTIPTGPNDLLVDSSGVLLPFGPNETIVLSDIVINATGFGDTVLDSMTATNTSEVGNGDPILANSFLPINFNVTFFDADPNLDYDPRLGPSPIIINGLTSILSTSGLFPANTSAPNFGIIPQYDGFDWQRATTFVLPDGSTLFIPDTTLNTTFTGQQQFPGPIFEDGFESGDVSVWSRTTPFRGDSDSDSLVLPFTVTTTGMMTLREPLVIPVVAPTLPQWGLVLLALVLLTLTTRRLAWRREVV